MGALVPGTAFAGGRPPSSFGKGDIGILNFALTLAYLEYAFYLEATKNNDATPFVDGQTKVFLDTVTADEKAHVDFLEKVLGNKAVKEPKFDFGTTTPAFPGGRPGARSRLPLSSDLKPRALAFPHER